MVIQVRSYWQFVAARDCRNRGARLRRRHGAKGARVTAKGFCPSAASTGVTAACPGGFLAT